MNFDEFMGKSFDRNKYNCAHFVSDVWLKLNNENIKWKLSGFLKPERERRAGFSLRRCFKKLKHPENGCLILFQKRRCESHVGIYLEKRVLHLRENGPVFEPLEIARIGFNRMTFYK